MAYDGTLKFDTKIDESGYDKGINSIESKASGVGDVIKGILGSQLIQKGLDVLKDAGQYCVQLASDLEEVQNVVDVTFGEGASEIESFAKTASDQFGLTELQVKQFSGTFGAMVKSMGLSEDAALDMAVSLTGLTGDLASFYNLDHETAFEKIRSGISGETEPLKQLGINMSVANLETYALSKGITTAYEKMSEAEKVQLRYGYILQQTTDAQGDFNRTQDSYANQVRLLQNNLDTLAANIGSALLPALTSAVGLVNKLFGTQTTNETTAKINDTIDDLEDLEEKLQNINNDYATTTIKINLDYGAAQELTDEFFDLKEELEQGFGNRTLRLGMSGEDVTALQNQLIALGYAVDLAAEVGTFGQTTEEALRQYQSDMDLTVDGIAGINTYTALAAGNTEKLAEKTADLVALYPELEEYVGENGVLSAEQAEVEALIDAYHTLAIAKAMETRVSGLEQAYIDAAADLEILKGEQTLIEKEKAELEKTRDSQYAAFQSTGLQFLNYRDGSQDLNGALNAVNQWIEAYGGLQEVIDDMTAAGKSFDLSKIIGSDGLALDASQIETDAEAIETLYTVLGQMYASYSADDLNSKIATANTQLDNISTAIDEYTPKVEALYEDYQKEKAAVETAIENLTNSGTESGGETAQNMAEGMLEKEAALDSAVETLAGSMQATANNHRILFPVGVRSVTSNQAAYSHATGLEYVPYDNYLARLHIGESVLPASEARNWRENGGRNGISQAQLTAAMAPVVNAIRDIKFTLNLDKKAIAEATVEENRTALSSYGKRIAKGLGK